MTIFVFMALVKVQCHFKDPTYSYQYGENCLIWYTNCAVGSGGHVDKTVYETCKIRAEVLDFNVVTWPESER